MTLMDIATSIPGLLSLALLGPFFLKLSVGILCKTATWISSQGRFSRQQTEVSEPIEHNTQGSNVISIATIEAMAHIKNHPSMRFIEKA